MFKTKEKGILIVISGPSGAGKGTIIQELLKQEENIWLSISMTSRPPRGTEQDKIDYYFVTKEEFEEKIKQNELLEYAIVHHDMYYGTPKAGIMEKINQGTDVILEIDIQGALKIKETVKESIFIFILPPSMEELKQRLTKRGTESEQKILERFQTAYNEINQLSKYNYVVINDQVETAVQKIKSIMNAEKCRVDRIEEVYLNTKEEALHESLIIKPIENKEFTINEEK